MGRATWCQRSARYRGQGELGNERSAALYLPLRKYSTNYVRREKGIKQQVLYAGNSVKTMTVSVEASLRKLRTTYIDILYVHWWDWDTSIEEAINGLHNLVQQGKVLYLVSTDYSMSIPSNLAVRSSRGFPTPLRGLYRKGISMRVIMERHPS